MNVSLETLQDVLDSHGADAERWPAERRSELLALCERSAEARASRAAAGELDSLLKALPVPAPAGRLAETILGDLSPRAQVHRLPLRRWAALAMPLAAAAALALWFTGPLAPGGSPVGPAADVAGGIELTENTLGLAASDVFTWEVPSDAFLEVAKLDPLADVPSFGCTYEDDLGCLVLSPTAGTGQTRGPAPQRILT
jgi:hypothetical protein